MTVEVRPLGIHCNLQCQYCYQNPQRDAGNLAREYDMDKMKAAISAEGGPFTVFGGEPLLVPKDDLEELWSWGAAEFGSNGIQTNGTLIDNDHVRMFKQYKVHVGISIDGPGEMNDVRWHGTLELTRAATQRTEQAIERLCREGIRPSIIITLHRNNAAADKLPILLDWVRYLDTIGVRSARLHLLEVESQAIRDKYALSVNENLTALLAFAEQQSKLRRLKFDVFADMNRMLLGKDERTTCIWNGCDPYTTRAVRGVEGHGQRSNCGRTNKDGIDFVKSSQPGFERYLALHATPQEVGGCQGCRFFLMCKGQCPGTAIDGDWRNRSEHCEVWKTLYAKLEQELLASGSVPLSLSPERDALEQSFLAAWAEGRQVTMSLLLHQKHQEHGDPNKTGGWQLEFQRLSNQLMEWHRYGPATATR